MSTATPRVCGNCGKLLANAATVWRFNEDPRPFCCINCVDAALREHLKRGGAS